jgi:alkylhydroperoxidase family enzyme
MKSLAGWRLGWSGAGMLVLLLPNVGGMSDDRPSLIRDGVIAGSSARCGVPAAPFGRRPRVPLLTDEEAWRRLPAAVRGSGQPLPTWARALAPSLPRTTAALLQLDFLHRAGGALDPVLRGRMRWIAAHANHCGYSEAQAEADLRRAGDTPTGWLAGEPAGFPIEQRDALVFARKLTCAADTVTDAEVSALVEQHGEQRVVAMVLLLAYASFQDRLILALDLPVEAGGPLPPLDVCFSPAPLGTRLAVPRTEPPAPVIDGGEREADAEWLGLDFGDLRTGMERQRACRARIRLPANEEGGAVWGLVCRAHQPELAGAWAACARTFDAEAEPDPVFAQSLFWVVTRSLQCFY